MTTTTRVAIAVTLLTTACDINIVGPDGSTGDTGAQGDADASAGDADNGGADADDGADGESDAATPIDSESSGGVAETDDGADAGSTSSGDGTSEGEASTAQDQGNETEDGAPTCENPSTCDECFGCASDPGGACDGEMTACNSTGECAEIVECWTQCNMLRDDLEYEACWFDTCVEQFPDAAQPFVDWVECGLQACESVC